MQATQPDLYIRNVGKMWRVMSGTTTLAFACDYPMARGRCRELIETGAAERVLNRRAQPCQ